jgi:hypothetical protein
VLRRGQRDGSIDAAVDAAWLAHRLWAELYAAHHYPGSAGRSPREVREMCLRTLVRAAGGSHG